VAAFFFLDASRVVLTTAGLLLRVDRPATQGTGHESDPTLVERPWETAGRTKHAEWDDLVTSPSLRTRATADSSIKKKKEHLIAAG
jgi:hypothetical protein